ncbi:hypothetical protein HJG60_011690 [Phyllostomus discolor]|uniref:Uncharacterized protein n=1 Tax=Phyllostomus discolor TaxID=89673 RepID=A0A833ZWA7_9CHIR|nr:hypothetical protein HJG60_011690 [Phyllostomus discolor]
MAKLVECKNCLHNIPFWIPSWLHSYHFISPHTPTVLGVPALELPVFIAVPRRPIAQVLLKEDIVPIPLASLPRGAAGRGVGPASPPLCCHSHSRHLKTGKEFGGCVTQGSPETQNQQDVHTQVLHTLVGTHMLHIYFFKELALAIMKTW